MVLRQVGQARTLRVGKARMQAAIPGYSFSTLILNLPPVHYVLPLPLHWSTMSMHSRYLHGNAVRPSGNACCSRLPISSISLAFMLNMSIIGRDRVLLMGSIF